MSDLHAVILAGGSGTRLWPMSRQQMPKQFLCLDGELSLLEATVARLDPVIPRGSVLIVTSEESAKGEAFQPLAPYQKLLEPVARNTAPAIALAATHFLAAGEDPVMVILPADHVIRDVPAFHACLHAAVEAAREGKLVTFGITPTGPETGFGYIKAGTSGQALPKVERFKEKPDAAIASAFLKEGGWYWNSGMFVWKASAIMEAVAWALPELAKTMAGIRADAKQGGDWQKAVRDHFPKCQGISIDHGVLEKAGNLFLVPAKIGWSDVGSWDAVHDIAPKDEAGNSIQGNVLAFDCKDTLIRGGKRLVAAVGVEGVSVIETDDAVLVAGRGASQDVRKVVDALAKRSAQEHLVHRTVRRPWGSYTVLEDGPGFKIKRIEVSPGARLSLQSHERRSEHWVVIAGEATVTRDGEVATLIRNQSTYVPIGAKHRLENRGAEPLHLIEVQVGDYVGEDDIRRYDDNYGR
ncbi:MAG TPA: mannose-1-phosphate guanylyltransferase/mannose-6-phosphate isomerase [Usitatibacteraceae bacterium]|nr:mannose-1-phosphate guanylyltransferase/mannose-6-phosphate isomerase [Usitatibacteraceae bacterium]